MTTYAIANESIWPSTNDIAASAGDGKLGKELQLTPWRLGAERNYVLEGFKVPTSSANLDLSVPLGKAMVGGYRVTAPGSTTITTVNGTTYLYLALTRDGLGNVNGAVFDRLSSQNDVPDYCLIAVLIASGGVITDTIDARRVAPYPGPYSGPSHSPSGSDFAAPGWTLISSNTSLGGVNAYQSFRLKAGVTLTLNQPNLVIMAEQVIEIAGTIDGYNVGNAGGPGGTTPFNGSNGSDQPGGAGGGDGSLIGGNGGSVLLNGLSVQAGGISTTTIGGNGSPLSASLVARALSMVTALTGGAGGGGGKGSGGGDGGRGGGTIVLIAPVIILAATATLITRGQPGVNASSGNSGGGGGGASGNIFTLCRQNWYSDAGCTFTQTGGAPGGSSGTGGNGGNGAAGKRIHLTWF